MSTRRSIGVLLLALSIVLLTFGLWRGYVRLFGQADDYLLVALMSPAVSDDLPAAKKAEMRDKIVSRGQKAEGVIATCCLIGASVLAWAGYRRLQPAPEPGASPGVAP